MEQLGLTIVADENIPAVEDMFQQHSAQLPVKIIRADGRRLSAEQVKNADVLLVRSVTKVNESLLAGSKVRFVGSATIGTDHLDKDYLQSHGIEYCSAPGCNADAVVEYVVSCLSHLLEGGISELKSKTIAVIGVGNVGGRLVKRLNDFGVESVMLNDPFRAKTESGFSTLQDCFASADIIAMHTPLTTTGEFPTRHLVTSELLSQLKPNAILINAGRGPAIKEQDLLACLKRRPDLKTVMDVWEHEPKIDSQLAQLVDIATPHIAGYSLEGKVRGTYMLKCALSEWLKQEFTATLNHFLPKPELSELVVSDRASIDQIIRVIYDPFADDRRFRRSLACENQPYEFDQLRKNYPERREFYSLCIDAKRSQPLEHALQNIGFTLR